MMKNELNQIQQIQQTQQTNQSHQSQQANQQDDEKIRIIDLPVEGLNCANCANKIELWINSLPGVRSASVGFASQKIRLYLEPGTDADSLTGQVKKIAGEIETGIRFPKPDVNFETEESEKESKWRFIKKITEEGNVAVMLVRLALSAAFLATALLWKGPSAIVFCLYIVSYLFIGADVLYGAVRNLLHGQVFDEKFLMCIATIGAFAIRSYPEAVSVMLFYQVGELVQDAAVKKSRKSICALLGIRPDYANIRLNGELVKIAPEQVQPGDHIFVRPGERIPIDGHIATGESTLDLAALTGESMPKSVEPNDIVLSGSINLSGLLEVVTEKSFGESTVSKIMEIVENANSRKAPIENFITKFSRIYTPIVVGCALILAVLPPLFLPGATFSDWVYRALVFLVVSCPCALVISIPLGFFGGIGGASKNGILVKGGNYLEALNNVDTVVFDKTGTLTKGVFAVTKIVSKNHESTENLLEYAALAELHSNHPIAHSIRDTYEKRKAETGSTVRIEDLAGSIDQAEDILGYGVRVMMEGKEILVGNTRLMERNGIEVDHDVLEEMGTLIHVVREGNYIGYLLIADELKTDAKECIDGLRKLGVHRIALLTGDRKSVGESIAKTLSIDEVYTDLLPVQKVEQLERIEKEKKGSGALLFVGDGINDAPVLARSDVGFAMGGVGSDAAIEAADIVIMTDEPSKVVRAIQISKRTRKIVWQNIVLALAVKGVVLLLGAGGIATMWEAVFADVGVAILAVLNSTRAMK